MDQALGVILDTIGILVIICFGAFIVVLVADLILSAFDRHQGIFFNRKKKDEFIPSPSPMPMPMPTQPQPVRQEREVLTHTGVSVVPYVHEKNKYQQDTRLELPASTSQQIDFDKAAEEQRMINSRRFVNEDVITPPPAPVKKDEAEDYFKNVNNENSDINVAIREVLNQALLEVNEDKIKNAKAEAEAERRAAEAAAKAIEEERMALIAANQKVEEEKRMAEEAARIAEEERLAKEAAARAAEEERLAKEAAAKAAEEERLAREAEIRAAEEEHRAAEAAAKAAEEERLAREAEIRAAELEEMRRIKEEILMLRNETLLRDQMERDSRFGFVAQEQEPEIEEISEEILDEESSYQFNAKDTELIQQLDQELADKLLELEELRRLKEESDNEKQDLLRFKEEALNKRAQLESEIYTLKNTKTEVVESFDVKRPFYAKGYYEDRLQKLLEELRDAEKDLKQNKREYIPLVRLKRTYERDLAKLRRKEAIVAKHKLSMYGVYNKQNIDPERKAKLDEDVKVVNELKESVFACDQVLKENKDRYPVLEKANKIITKHLQRIRMDIENAQNAINWYIENDQLVDETVNADGTKNK